jgi:hypothetical protein
MNEGLYEWSIMPFFLTNASSTFIRFMNEVIKDSISKFSIVYLDDILIFNKTKEEHLRHLEVVLRRLHQENLLVSLKKCSFMKTKLVYLGFIISSNELKMDPEKVRAIRDWPSPRSVFEVRFFHGLEFFYRKFIRNFNSICTPILDTIRKEHNSFNWKEEAKKGFRVLKAKITEQPILVMSNFKKTFQVKCDASGVAIGAILSQDSKLVAYFSEKMNYVKRKYSTYDK